MKYPFVYTVHCYDFDEEDYYLENGIGICDNFKDAADILEVRYGNDLIAIKHLELYEESTVITLSKGTFDEVVDCLDSGECFQLECNEKGERIF